MSFYAQNALKAILPKEVALLLIAKKDINGYPGVFDYSGPPHDPEAEYPLTAWQPHKVNHVSLFGGHHEVWTVVTPVGQGASAFAIDKIEMVKPIKRIGCKTNCIKRLFVSNSKHKPSYCFFS